MSNKVSSRMAQRRMLEEGGGTPTFSARFLIILLGLVLAALVAGNAIWLFPSLNRIAEDVTARHAIIAERARASFLQFFQFRQAALASLAGRIGREPEHAANFAQIFLKENESFEHVVLLDAERHEWFRLDRPGFSGALSGHRFSEEAFGQVFAGKPYFGEVFYAQGEPMSMIMVPLYRSDSAIAGVLQAAINFRSIWNLTEEIREENGYRVYVVDRQGNVIADPDPSTVLGGENVYSRSIVYELLRAYTKDATSGAAQQRRVSGRYTNSRGEDVFAVGIPVEGFGWGVFVERAARQAFAARDRMLALAGVFLFIVLVLVAVVGWTTHSVVRFSTASAREREHIGAILSNLTTGIVEYDQHFAIRLMNPAAERLLNTPFREIASAIVEPRWHHDPRRRSIAKLFFADANDAKTEEIPFLGPRNADVHLSVPMERDMRVTTMPIMGDAGEVTNYLKIIQDVTQEKFIGRIKSEFINIAAHQLRTPLSAIKWALRLLLDGDAGELRARQRDILEQGYRTNERMIRLVNDLLNVSRIEEGRFGYQFAKHDLRAFLLEVLEGSRMELEKKQLRLHIDIPQTLGLFTFDPEKLRLALMNVLENAVNYTPAGGEVSLAAHEQAQFVEMTITDTGVGIPKEDRARIFTKFFRGSNVVRMQTEGSGLGLFLVKNIMLNHGGSVHIASAEEKGTVVTLRLPRSEAAIPQEEQTFEEFVTGL